MSGHYETLGVARDASPEDIKAAYRRASSAAHPDREGGSTEKQQAVNMAYEVLSDPKRRASYDQGGDGAVDNIQDQAREMFVNLLKQAMGGSGSWLDAVSVTLTQQRNHLQIAHANSLSLSAKLTVRIGKIRAKNGDNLVESLIAEELKRLDSQATNIERGLRVVEETTRILANYETVEETREDTLALFHRIAAQNGTAEMQNLYRPTAAQQSQGLWGSIFGGA